MVENVLSHRTKRISWRSDFSWLRRLEARCFQTWWNFLYKIKNKLWILIKNEIMWAHYRKIDVHSQYVLNSNLLHNCFNVTSALERCLCTSFQNEIFLEDTHKVLSGGGVDKINGNTCLTLKRGTISKPFLLFRLV